MAGRFKKKFSDQEILNYVFHNNWCTAPEIAERFEITRQGVHARMKKLIKKGLATSKPGARRIPTRFHVASNRPWKARIYDK